MKKADNWESEGVPVVNEDLDRDITLNEIESSIKRLKTIQQQVSITS